MSCEEFHKGRLAVRARNDKEIIEYAKKNDLILKWNIKIEDDKIIDHDCYDDDKFAILTLNRYKDNQTHVLIEYLDHTSIRLDDEDIPTEFKRVSEDEFEFMTSFYNGGCCEDEIWEDELEKVDLFAEYEKENDTIIVTPRESYIILDCFQFVLNKMDKENIDYLFCNYSKEEIAKCGQRFGDMNLKNRW